MWNWYVGLLGNLTIFFSIYFCFGLCRMSLLLGPPSSGKTTLLLALAGRLGKDLKVRAYEICFCFNNFTDELESESFKAYDSFNSIADELQFSGRVSYNGHGMEEFVPQRTSAYISQTDLHIGEMTVRETLAFSARCQGIGTRYGQFTLALQKQHSQP